MKIKKICALLLAITLSATTLTACGGGDEGETTTDGETTTEDSGTIKIGALAPLNGQVAVYGIAASNGLKLAVEERNAGEGVLGKQVELKLEDEEGDATKAINAYNKLMGEGIVALWGDITSKPTIAVAAKAAKDGMPMITPTSTATAVTKDVNNVFRACFLDPYQGESLASYSKEKVGAQKVAVLYDATDDYSIGLAEAYKAKAEELGMEVVYYDAFQAGDTDFKSQLSTIKTAAPEALFIPSYYNTIALIADQAKALGIETQFIGADGWDGVLSALTEENKSVVDGAIFANHYYIGDESEVVKSFVDAYTNAYGEAPNAFAALGYDAANILMDSIENAGSTDPVAIIEEMQAIQHDGVTGSIKYAGNGDPVKSITLITIKDGEYQLLEKYEAK